MSAHFSPPIRALLLAGTLVLAAPARGSEPIVVGPNCTNLFEASHAIDASELEPFFGSGNGNRSFFGNSRRPHSPDLPKRTFVPIVAEPSFIAGADEILDAAKEKNWTRVAELMNQAGIPVRVDTWTKDGQSFGGVTFELGDFGNIDGLKKNSPLTEDPIIRAMRRLRYKWNKFELDAEMKRKGRKLSDKEIEKFHAEKNAAFSTISIVDDLLIPTAHGNYTRSEPPQIKMQMEAFEDYLKNGNLPRTLSHELRHAGFHRFEETRFAGGKNFYSARLKSTKGYLASAGELSVKGNYEKYVAAEEPYTHLRDYRNRLLKIRERIEETARANSGPFHPVNAAAMEGVLKNTGEWNGRALLLAGGVKSDLKEAFTAALSGEATVSLPFGEGKVLITLEREKRTLELTIVCPDCGNRIWGRQAKAKDVVREMMASADHRLGEMKSTLESTKTLLEALEKSAKASATTNAEKPVTGAEFLRKFDEVVAKIVALIESEPKFGAP